MTPDDSMLLQNMLDRLGTIEAGQKTIMEELGRLNGMPGRVRSLEMWRSGLTAVIAFVTVSLGLALNWLKGR